MNRFQSIFHAHSSALPERKRFALKDRRNEGGFTLIELLTVLAIIAILTAITAPLIPSLVKADQIDVGILTLSGLLEQARETAISSNSFVWVAFTDAPVNSPTGTWVAMIQSIDGTETGVNTAVVPAWASSITVPGANLQLLSKIQHLPGIKIVDATSLPASLTANAPDNPSPLFESGAVLQNGSTQGPVTWTVTTLQNTNVGAGVYFTHALEFTPTGEAHVPTTWSSNIQFGFIPSIGPSKNLVLFNVARLTGKTTVYRQ